MGYLYSRSILQPSNVFVFFLKKRKTKEMPFDFLVIKDGFSERDEKKKKKEY